MDREFQYEKQNNMNGQSQGRPDIYDDNYDSDIGGYTQASDDYYRSEPSDYQSERKRKTKKHKSKLKRFISKLLLFALSLLTAVLILGWIISLTLPAKTTFLIMATDKDGTRTDTLMYGVFDKETKDISLVSIPRDTYITVSDDVYSKMCEEYPQPGSKSMKINSVMHFGGEKYGKDMIIDQVELLTDSEIDFYAKVDFEAFRYIIDSVGGIDFYVPQDMEYHDPLQDLHISLKEGNQHLNGEQAEQLVRFRSGYANADLGRVGVQQQFMKAFISQTFSTGTILSKPGVFLDLLFKQNYIDTDVGFMNAVSYAFVIKGVDSSKIETSTLPGKAGYANGQSVYIYDEAAGSEMLADMMK